MYKVSSIQYQVFAFFLLFFLSIVPSVSAHVLKLDGSIGVTVHIDPGDEPVAKSTSTIFVTIKDANKQFDEKNPVGCDCVLQIIKAGKVIKSMPITSGSVYDPLTFDFPTNGTYLLRVTGTPNGKGRKFQPFSTDIEYYVKSASSPTIDKASSLLIYFPYLVLLSGVVILSMFLNPFTKRSKDA